MIDFITWLFLLFVLYMVGELVTAVIYEFFRSAEMRSDVLELVINASIFVAVVLFFTWILSSGGIGGSRWMP